MKRRINPSSPRRRPTITPADALLSYWLRRASNQISQSLSLKLQDKGISLAEWVVLRELYDGDRRPSALAAKLGLTRGAISKLARRLVASLMITQESDSGDGRGQMLALSALGRAAATVFAGLADENEKEFFGHLDPDTRGILKVTLREIVRRRGLRAPPVDSDSDSDSDSDLDLD